MWLNKMTAKILISLLIFNGASYAQTKDVKGPQDPAMAAQSQNQSDSSVLSFMEWKSARVHEAQQKVEEMNKSQDQTQVWQEGKPTSETSAPMDEQKLNFNVDVALQLNVQDYFSMYLKNLDGEAFKQATKKMSQDEVAELLLAYKNAQEKDKKIPLKFSKIPKNNAKSKKTEI